MKYTFKQFQDQYPDDDACLDAIMHRHYGPKPTCPGCGVIGTTFHRITKRRAYACAQCGHHIFPCAGTIFEKSSTKLSLWFHAIYLLTATRNGVSAKELQRQLGVTYKCAWRIGHQLRDLMAARNKNINPGPLSGFVEVDETFVGGKAKNKHASKRTGLRGTADKAIVIGAVQREGKVVARVIENTETKTLDDFVNETVSEDVSLISTDEHSGYRLLKLKYPHARVTHSQGEYVNGNVHTNTIEGFWSHLKRGIRSTHASVSPKHLDRYVGEFAFRFNHRHDPAEMFARMLSQVANKN
jgi:transposase